MHWILSGCFIYLLRLFVVYINLWTSYTVKCLHWKKETFPKWTGYGQTLETLINDMLLSEWHLNADNSKWRVFYISFLNSKS